MKKLLLLFVALATTSGLLADEWQLPVYSGKYSPLGAEEFVYIYNTEAKMFLVAGNDWGTHASVGEAGAIFAVSKYVASEEEGWDGKTYTIVYAIDQENEMHDTNLFITDGGNIYLDRREQADYFFSFKDLGNNTYQIYGADINPVWNATGDNADYMVGRYTKYTAVIDQTTKETEETGTGVIYDFNGADTSYGAGEFQTTWAFVSLEDYEAYKSAYGTYQAAMTLKNVLDKADEIGVPGLDDERAVFANTSSDYDTLMEAVESVNKKTLAYYEVYVTPDKPMPISTDDCSSIEYGWVNEINATTWDTQSWIDDAWTGFEGTTLNIWGASLKGKAYKEWFDLPNGIYVVKMAVYSEKLDGYVYANQNKIAVKGAAAGAVYEVTTNVTDGTLEYGFGQDTEGTNWVAIDNAVVTYYGKGTEALKYWLNSLKESTADYSDAYVQPELVAEYNAVMEDVKKAETEEEILAVIPKMEDIVNRIGLNMAAYAELEAAVAEAETLLTDENINTYYGDKLGDMVSDKQAVLTAHKLATEAVQKEAAELTTLTEDAQAYIWRYGDFLTELETAEAIYTEYKATCTAEAKAAYEAFVAKNGELTAANNLTLDDMDALLDELYDIEFDLQLSAEPASDDNPQDYTAKVYNNGFFSSSGWTNDGWATADNNSGWNPTDGVVMDSYYLNLWNPQATSGRIYQEITKLPAGTYVVEISAYAKQQGMQVYANDDYLDVVLGTTGDNLTNENGVAHIYDGSDEPAEFTYTNEEGNVVEVWYGNIYKIVTVVGEDGKLEIGVRGINNDDELWGMADNVNLYYHGTASTLKPTHETGIAAVNAPAKASDRTYNLAGQAVNASYKGIVIKNGKKYLLK